MEQVLLPPIGGGFSRGWGLGGSWDGVCVASFKPTHGVLKGYYVQNQRGGGG